MGASSRRPITYIDSANSSYLSPAESASRRSELPSAIQDLPNGQPEEQSPVPRVFSNAAFPRVIWNLNPDIKFKLRKRFYPLGVTCLTLGADLDVRTHEVGFKWSWKDRLIGGRLEFFANQISLTKRFDVDNRTKLDVRAAFDLQTRRTLFSLNIKPFGIVPHDRPPSGLTVKQTVPLDRHMAVEVHGRLSVPEARFSNETQTAVSLGEGNFVFDLDQLNFRFLLQ